MECEIGTDIQKIDDFVNVKEYFLKKIFSDEEIEYCKGKSKPAQHYAARFAVKESTIKAFSQFNKIINYKDIEIIMNKKKPIIKLKKSLGNYGIKVSMSHSGEYAMSFVMIENGKK